MLQMIHVIPANFNLVEFSSILDVPRSICILDVPYQCIVRGDEKATLTFSVFSVSLRLYSTGLIHATMRVCALPPLLDQSEMYVTQQDLLPLTANLVVAWSA